MACIDFANDFMKKYKNKFEKAGATVQKKEILDLEYKYIGSITDQVNASGSQLAITGKHHFIEVTEKGGKTMIFDNAHPLGILKEDFIKNIEAAKFLENGQVSIKSGAALYNAAEVIK